MKYSTRHLLAAAVSSLSLAACAAQPGIESPMPVAAAPALAGAPLDVGVPSQLPRIARPVHYDISVTPDAKALRFAGEAGIDLELYEPSATLTLNALDLSFASASLTGADGKAVPLTVAIDAAAQTATFTAPASLAPGKYRLTTRYTGTINTQANGLFALDYPDKATGSEVRGLFTQFEAPDARRFVPSFDEPSYKATFTLSATVPAGDLAVSNMPVTSETPVAGGKKKVTFQISPKMSSYLLFFATGNFERLAAKSESGPQVGIVSPRGSGEQARFALDSLGPLLGYYSDYFGQPYPLPKLDNVAGPGQSQFFGAMENWGAIFTFERILLDDPKITSDAVRQQIYSTQAHEVAHQWFGDLVTMAWWDDLWLNEGFASWMETKASDHFHPDWQPLLDRVGGREGAMALDAFATTHPIVQTIRTVEDTNQAFDAITYQKGEAVITMLEAYAGQNVWREGLRTYMAKHKYANTRTDDLWNAVEAAGAKGLTAIAHDFTNQPGIPLLRVGAVTCAGGNTTVELTQAEFSRDRKQGIDAENRRWQVPVLARVGQGAVTRQVISGGSGRLTLPGCGAVLINAGQAGYYRTLYSPAALTALRGDFATLAPIDQLGLLGDNFALAYAGYQPMGAALELLAATPQDASQKLLGDAAGRYAALYAMFDDQPAVQKQIAARGGAALGPAMQRLGFDARPSEPALDSILRSDLLGALGTLGDAKVLAEARRRFALLDSNPAALDGPLKSRWLDIVAANANEGEWAKLRAMAKGSKSAVERSAFYTFLGNAKDAALAKRALDLALTDEPGKTVSAGIIGAVAKNHPELAVDFAQANQAAVDRLIDASARARFLAGLAAASNDPAMIAKLERIAAPLPADVRKPYDKTLASLKERSVSRPRIKGEVASWLKAK
ncbi:peptidase M1, membrane alanine aminopeptidase [Sphingopyxis fribergensis]|uniref:Aminopeptidase n=1 Tax=Sphingopyxis fribergensis TaxID=1515612 RepID=A0A0A7PAT0_9SPHN|nr:M1 family metallopeptidase [Sphingopyxis fribergensis]AJA07054.1 peptidase M1, membrane alanine aminopeptidase [Sphingopyxis fribergensis]